MVSLVVIGVDAEAEAVAAVIGFHGWEYASYAVVGDDWGWRSFVAGAVLVFGSVWGYEAEMSAVYADRFVALVVVGFCHGGQGSGWVGLRVDSRPC